MSAADFLEPWQADPAICATAAKIAVEADPQMGFASARLEIGVRDRAPLAADVTVARGHPGNPMTWDDQWLKFRALAEPHLKQRTSEAFDLLRRFGDGDVLPTLRALLATVKAH